MVKKKIVVVNNDAIPKMQSSSDLESEKQEAQGIDGFVHKWPANHPIIPIPRGENTNFGQTHNGCKLKTCGKS